MFDSKKNENYFLWDVLLVVLVFFSFYFAIGSYPLFDNNEGLYASIGKYMLLSKSFVIPYLNCVPYIEKPPLLYWLLSLSFSAFDFTAFAARFVTTTSAVLLCVLMLNFSRKLKQDRLGVISAIIFASSIGVSIVARMVYFDMLFALLLGATFLGLFSWYETQEKFDLRISAVLLALAILTKGLIAIVFVFGVFGLFLFLEGNFRRCRKALDPAAIILFLIVVLPWHILAFIQHKGFGWYYFISEHFLRFLDLREPHDYYNGPVYYYLPRIMIYLFPWSLFAPLLFWPMKPASEYEARLLRFNWCWLLVPLLFFSFSSAKANYYMIVGMPALIFILGIKIKNLLDRYNPKIFTVWSAIILFMFASGLIFFIFSDIFVIDGASKRCLFIVIAYCMIAGTACLVAIKKPAVSIVSLAGLIIPVVFTMVTYVQNAKNEISSAEAGIYLTSHAGDKSLYLYQDFEDFSALGFYAPACFKMIDSHSSDLYYGAHSPKFKNRFVSKEEFLQEVFGRQAYVVVPLRNVLDFYSGLDPQLKHLSPSCFHIG